MKSTQEWSKDHKKELGLLVASIMAGPELDTEVQDTIQTLKEMSGRPGEVHYRGRGLAAEVFPLLAKDGDGLPLWHVTDMACDLYGRVIKKLPRDITSKLSAPESMDISYANRDVRLAAQDMTLVAKGLMADSSASIRRKGRSVLLAARMLSISAPPPLVFKVNECLYCHRHTLMRTACVLHRVEGRYTAAKSQRGSFQEALAEQAHALRAHLRSDPALLDGLMSDLKAPQVLVQVCTSLFKQEVSDSVIQAVEIASRRTLDGAKASPPFASLQDVINAWHALPQIGDPEGLQAIKQSPYPPASEFLAHLTRYNAYVVSGGEVAKRKRNPLRSPKELAQMFALLKTMTHREVAAKLDISMTQLRHRMQEAEESRADTRLAWTPAKAPKTIKVTKGRSAAKTSASKSADNSPPKSPKKLKKVDGAPVSKRTPSKTPKSLGVAATRKKTSATAARKTAS